jgi:hypothetical protein
MKGVFCFLLLSLLITGCGNVEWCSSYTTNEAPPSTLSPGESLTLTAGSHVYVPAGSTVTTNSRVVTVYGHNNTVHTEAGAVVSVPPGAAGAADNLVTTQ